MSYMFAFVPCPSGLLRLCAPRRCQPGVFHDPGTHLTDELVVDILPHQPTRQDQQMTIVTMTDNDD